MKSTLLKRCQNVSSRLPCQQKPLPPLESNIPTYQCLYQAYVTQTELVKCRDDTMAPERHDMAAAKLRSLARESGMAKIMRERGIDIIISASDASLISFSSCAGWPVATVPVSNLSKNGQPWGLFVLAREGSIDILLRFLRIFHGCFGGVMGPASPFE